MTVRLSPIAISRRQQSYTTGRSAPINTTKLWLIIESLRRSIVDARISEIYTDFPQIHRLHLRLTNFSDTTQWIFISRKMYVPDIKSNKYPVEIFSDICSLFHVLRPGLQYIFIYTPCTYVLYTYVYYHIYIYIHRYESIRLSRHGSTEICFRQSPANICWFWPRSVKTHTHKHTHTYTHTYPFICTFMTNTHIYVRILIHTYIWIDPHM